MSESLFRFDFDGCLMTLEQRVREPAPTKVQLFSGPRQVGKTTLLTRLEKKFEGKAIFAAADSPEASIGGFWERLWKRAEDLAHDKGTAILLLDEIQSLEKWAVLLKSEWDRIVRKKIPIHIIASGSSALLLGKGSKESLAGRFERLTLSHWSPRAMVQAFDISSAKAVENFVRFGSYPGAFPLRNDLPRWKAYVRDAIIEPAIGRDILAIEKVRRPALLRQVFAIAAGSPAQIVALQKLQGQLHDRGALETIAHYLHLLEEAFLVAPVEKFSKKTLRQRTSPPKLVLLNNALISALHAGGAPDSEKEPDRFGTWVENACLAHAWNSGQSVTYWREEPMEVDAVLEGDWGKWAVEIKTGPVRSTDLRGLLEFTKRYRDFTPLLLCDPSETSVAERAGIRTIAWQQYLLEGL